MRQALLNLPDKIGVTANLNINYRAPTRADQVRALPTACSQPFLIPAAQFIVIKTQVGDVNGRKALVSGIVQDLEGKELANAS